MNNCYVSSMGSNTITHTMVMNGCTYRSTGGSVATIRVIDLHNAATFDFYGGGTLYAGVWTFSPTSPGYIHIDTSGGAAAPTTS